MFRGPGIYPTHTDSIGYIMLLYSKYKGGHIDLILIKHISQIHMNFLNFHMCHIYTSYFILETDQKPLEAILSKSINQATLRLQRILIRSFPYHFIVWYILGLTNQLVDCLSHLGGQKDSIKLPKLYAYQITNQLCARSDSIQQIRIAMQEDDELVLLKHTITQGWPSTIKEVPSVLQSYWTFREELTIENGIIMKGTRIVKPVKKHKAVLKLIHEGHLVLNKSKQHAKETVYWPGLNDQLAKMALNCELCLKYSQSKCKQKHTMSFRQEIPLHHWTKLSTDLFHFEDASYLLIVDYTNRFLVVHKLSSMSWQHVANQWKQIFTEYGWPETLISHNGPCYPVDVFTSVLNHITNSPHYPQINGLAKKYVKIVKSLFYKAKEEENDLFKCLIIYCKTPLSGSLQSLMQML